MNTSSDLDETLAIKEACDHIESQLNDRSFNPANYVGSLTLTPRGKGLLTRSIKTMLKSKMSRHNHTDLLDFLTELHPNFLRWYKQHTSKRSVGSTANNMNESMNPVFDDLPEPMDYDIPEGLSSSSDPMDTDPLGESVVSKPPTITTPIDPNPVDAVPAPVKLNVILVSPQTSQTADQNTPTLTGTKRKMAALNEEHEAIEAKEAVFAFSHNVDQLMGALPNSFKDAWNKELKELATIRYTFTSYRF